MVAPSKLIQHLVNLANSPMICRLLMASEIALVKKYGYPFAAISYLARQMRDSDNLEVMHQLIIRHTGSKMLLMNACLMATNAHSQDISFGLIALNENIRAILKVMVVLQREEIAIHAIDKGSDAYTRLCVAAHTGWSTVVLSDHNAIMKQIKESDSALYLAITELNTKLINAINKKPSHDEELSALNLFLQQNITRIEQYTSQLELCGPQRKLRTLGNAYALAKTEYARLSPDEQEKDQVLVNGTLCELEIIYHELNQYPSYCKQTLNDYDSTDEHSKKTVANSTGNSCQFTL
jgi:hypothetical protein